MKKLSSEETELLKALILNGIGNGNTVNPKPFIPTPKQYKTLHSIMIKFDKKNRRQDNTYHQFTNKILLKTGGYKMKKENCENCKYYIK